MDDYGIADTNDPSVRILWEQHGRTVVVIPVRAPEPEQSADSD